ncbi:MAG: tyrosine-type recombinase/integrase [Candidatus Pacebacteria bacterium]|jgi:site-specific recombinase XerD|nr:tyrosine-type recombinase/integrase [Candidatus Paceibacterota bacterium]MBT4004686.1 tyrosine-type recombinase/integrase [Candidatus Paceibacterota bacterium]MBT4358395.1 tyrosine-type recombinase/integrase [Candidatus Paceibacterota bacterium]MBT4680830.1 tyrosine-type recombinase/integrase [Candidatus Paceibacterota bacterium]MBT7183359.1 tyrosine-type recombinase/integrase [Candidatus Paceibacterota bacterium]
MPMLLTDAHAQYKNYLLSEGKAEATVTAYTKDVEQLVNFVGKQGKTQIDEVSTDDIQEFKDLLKKQRYTGKSVSRKINSIKSFFRFMVSKGEVDNNPAMDIQHPKYETAPPRVLSKIEYRALRDAARGDERMYAIIEILLQTGMRISELANLKLEDVDLERNILDIQAQKTRGARKLPLNAAAKESLLSYLEVRPRAREKTVFLTKTCRPFLVRNIRTAIDRYFRLAGIKNSKVNDLRHTFIAEQLKAGTPLVYVSQLVGHKRITTTEKYLKLIDETGVNPNVKIEEL